MTEPRSGRMDVFAPAKIDPNKLDAYIRGQLANELAKSGEHAVRVSFQTGRAVPGKPGVMKWSVLLTTGPANEEIW